MSSAYNKEIFHQYSMSTVMEEAQRCLLCYDAPCSRACPAETDPARFIRSVRFRNLKGAAETITENNALGAVCARVCPTEHYCQKGCTRSGIDRPIDIGGIQRFVTDFQRKAGMKVLRAGKPNGRRVAIVGSGPSGLEAAARLLQTGYSVTVFEEKEKPGGYLRYGIPEYRLPASVVDEEIRTLEELGCVFRCGVKIGGDSGVTMDSLKKEYDAVLVAVGYSAAKTLPLFKDNPYAETAVDFLARVKETGSLGGKTPDHVVVIGGGDVAMDVSTTLKKLGVPHVTVVVYEEFSEFLASKAELEGARELGVTIIDGYVPVSAEGGSLVFRHRRIDGELRLKADKVILAVGQLPDLSGLVPELKPGQKDFPDCRTDDPKVFLTGDIVAGDKTVVWAVKRGKEAARVIHESLEGRNR